MDIDDEPPMLVEAGEQAAVPDQLSTDMDDLNMTRVPITIITGKPLSFGPSFGLTVFLLAILLYYSQAIILLRLLCYCRNT